MSFLDSIISQVTGGGQANPLLSIVTGMITHQSGGGIAGLLEQFAAAGLGQQAASWVGTGPNQPIGSDHITQVFGEDKIKQIAEKLGMDPNLVSTQLAALIPQVVDKLTPGGAVPEAGGMQSAITGLLQNMLKV